MADCEKLQKCLFFNDKMAAMPASAELMKKRFCKGDKRCCARYQVAVSGAIVPPILFPNQKDKVKELILKK
ncbi:MAG: hypothetical protein HGA78_10640 [Nitrospirales bacterium]|nr:hypothetical protein [Nitrospirales bacterium]